MKKRLLPLFMVAVTICAMLFSTTANAITYDSGQTYDTQAIALINLDTGMTVYQKNADAKMYPASTTKIMTYIIAAENIEDLEGTEITVTKEALNSIDMSESSLAGISVGEKLTAYQLLNLMMIPSGNDAAAVLAYYVGGGSEEAFVEKMNAKAQELGCTGTHFQNAHGLQNEDHYTTANDMAKIAQYATTLPYFTEITSKTSYELPATNKNDESRTVTTTNKMLLTSEPDYYYTYATGIKTGTTDEAGYCIVSSAVYNNTSYLCVALGAPSVDKDGETVTPRMDMIDSANLYRWAFTKLSKKTLADTDTAITEVKLKYVWGRSTMLLTPESTVNVILPADINTTSVMVDLDVPDSISAPLHPGDIVGTATYTYAGEEIAKVNLIVNEEVSRNEVLVVIDVIWSIISNPIFIVCVILAAVLLIIYITLIVRYNKKKNEQLRRKKKFKRK